MRFSVPTGLSTSQEKLRFDDRLSPKAVIAARSLGAVNMLS